MSQTDTPTYLSAADLLGKTERTKLISVEIPELADDEGNPGVILLRPPTAAMAQKFLATSKNRAAMAKVKAGQGDEDAETIEAQNNISIFGGLIIDLAVTPERKPLFPGDTTSEDVVSGMPAPVLNRLVTALTAAISAQNEEGETKAKKSKKTRRTASATKSRGAAGSKSGS